MTDIRNFAMWMFANEEDYGEDDRHYYDDRPNPIFSNTFWPRKVRKQPFKLLPWDFMYARSTIK